MAGRVDDGDIVLGRLKLPQGDVNGDAALTLRLQLVHDPGILEGTLHNVHFKWVNMLIEATLFSTFFRALLNA